MKHLTTFASKEAYESARDRDQLARPNVSLAGDEIIYLPVEHGPTVEMVDLGLPSGLKWANMNVGASKPEEFGLYFAWGDVEGIEYVDETSFTGKFSSSWYNTLPVHNLTTDITPESGYDAARVNMKGNWRMPTKTDLDELLANTTQTVETVNGVSGTKFVSKVEGNSNFIFVPFAGIGLDGSLNNVGGYLSLWSSSVYASYTQCALGLSCDSYDSHGVDYDYRYRGFSVRGVCE